MEDLRRGIFGKFRGSQPWRFRLISFTAPEVFLERIRLNQPVSCSTPLVSNRVGVIRMDLGGHLESDNTEAGRLIAVRLANLVDNFVQVIRHKELSCMDEMG